MKLNTYTLAIVLSLSLVQTGYAAPDKVSSKQSELKQLDQEINALKKDIKSQQRKQTSINKKLKATEIELGKISSKLDDTNTKINAHSKNLAAIAQQNAQYQTELKQQQQQLADQLRAAYYLEDTNYLKLLLSPKNSKHVSDAVNYYQYIHNMRMASIEETRDTLAKIEQNKIRAEEENEALLALKKTQQSEQKTLNKLNKDRQNSLQELKQTLQSQQAKVSSLTDEKAQLQQVINKLIKQTAKKPVTTKVDLNKAKGKLKWPVDGTITQNFGTNIPNTNVKSNGVFIKTQGAKDVGAIAPGKVIFADWLKGYGLIVIIDHGNGYLSLYGHNRSLMTQVGDSVETGTVIAKTGQSGGLNENGLYFEIRQQGKPVNPKHWSTA